MSIEFSDESDDRLIFANLIRLLINEKNRLKEEFDTLAAACLLDPFEYLENVGDLCTLASKYAMVSHALNTSNEVEENVVLLQTEIELTAFEGFFDEDNVCSAAFRPFRNEMIRDGLFYFRDLILKAGKDAFLKRDN